MHVICTLDATMYWQQLCSDTPFDVVESYSSINEQASEIVFIKANLTFDELNAIASPHREIVIVVAPPFVALHASYADDSRAALKKLQTQLINLYTIFKTNKIRLNLVPLASFCVQYSVERPPLSWIKSIIDTTSFPTDAHSVLCYGLANQSYELNKAYKKLQSCFLLQDDERVFYPNLLRFKEILAEQADTTKQLEEENSKLMIQNQLLLERLEASKLELDLYSETVSMLKQNQSIKQKKWQTTLVNKLRVLIR